MEGERDARMEPREGDEASQPQEAASRTEAPGAVELPPNHGEVLQRAASVALGTAAKPHSSEKL